MPFEKGNKFGNRKGRPIGALGRVKTSQLELLLEALAKIGEEEKEEFMLRVARLAYHDVTMTKEVLKKMVADRSYLTEIKEGDGSVREPITFNIVSSNYSNCEFLVNGAVGKMGEPIEQLRNHQLTVDKFKEVMINLMLKCAKEDEDKMSGQDN